MKLNRNKKKNRSKTIVFNEKLNERRKIK